MTSSAPARSTARDDRRPSSMRGEVADADRCRARGARSGRSPGTRRRAARATRRPASRRGRRRRRRSGRPSGSYSWRSSLTSVVLPAPFSPTIGDHRAGGQVEADVVEHQPVGARVGERHVLEADAVRQPVGRRPSARAVDRRGVVLEPGEPPRAVEPDAAQEAELADRRADVLRQPAAGDEHEHDVAGGRVEPVADEHDRADVAAAEHRPRQRVPHRRPPPRRGDRRVPRSHAARGARATRSIADAGDAHLLARRRGGAEHEQVAGQAVVLRRRAPRARRSTAGRHVDGQHGRQRRTATSSTSAGWIEHQQHDRDAEPQDPAERREQRHEQVVEREDLVAQHRQPVEVLGPLVVLDGGDRRLQPATCASSAMVDPVAEPALHAVPTDLQEPGRRRRTRRGRARPAHDRGPVVVEHAVGEQLQPQREQRVGQRREQRQQRTRRAAAAARRGSRACTSATATAARAAGRVSASAAQARTS